MTADEPAAAIVALATPPIRACEELAGIPRYQVARFHRMLPARPAITIVRGTVWLFARPPAMVAATAVDQGARQGPGGDRIALYIASRHPAITPENVNAV